MGSEAPGTKVAEVEYLQNPTEAFAPADFRRLAEHLPHMVWICKPDGTLDYLNSHGQKYFGVKLRRSVTLFPSGAIAHPDDHAGSCAAWKKALDLQMALSMEARLLRADGAFRWHQIRAEPITDDAGQIVKWMGTSTNVQSVKEGEELSAFLLEMSTDFARIDNPHELVSTAMLHLRRRLGAAQVTLAEYDEARGQVVLLRQDRSASPDLQVATLPVGPFESLTAEAREGSMTVLDKVPADERIASLFSRWYGLDRVGAVLSAPLLQGGQLIASLSVAEETPRHWSMSEVEMTRRVAELVWPALEKARSDHSLAVSEERMRLAQAVAQIGAWELDPQTQSVHFSAESHDLFGLTQNAGQADLYQLWMSLIDPRDGQALKELIDACNQSGAAEAEYRYRHPVRGLRWIHTRAGRVDDETPTLIVGISLDVTERRKAEEALKDVNHQKDEFLAMLAHELRNPLAPIRNAAQVLRAHSTGVPELEWARTVIERQTQHLVRLVDELLDVSRMVRGKIVLKKANVEIAELIQHAVDTSQPLIRARRHQLHVNVPPGSLTIEGDLTRLAQVLANLLNNAAKYMDEGGQIWLDVWAEGGEVVLRVRDTGPGISRKLLPHVFDLFTQAERTLDRSQGGLGIGLTLVKLLVEMHGGSVEARNTDTGSGAELIVRLPASAAIPTPPSGEQTRDSSVSNASAEKALKVLVVDDNVDAADSIALLLTIDGFNALSVHGAVAALDTVDSFKPDVVLLDIGLPVMDGYEVARRLRSHIPIEDMRIVALSGYGQRADRERAVQAGFDDYLVKPVEPTVLSQFLRSLQ
jgi:PAS domain S-box-containing protein